MEIRAARVICASWLLGVYLSALPLHGQDQITDQGHKDSAFVPEEYVLTVHDEFDRLRLDPDVTGTGTWASYFPWTEKCPGYNVRRFPDNNNQQLWVDRGYTRNGITLGVTLHEVTEQGTLKLYGKRTPKDKLEVVDGLPHVAGMISTQCSFWQQYGYFEGRMRFDFTKGHHWAFWLLPKDHLHVPIELDIVERVGIVGEFNRIYQNSHGGPDHPITYYEMPGDYRDWVTYGLTWTATEIVWHVNGKETRRIPNYIAEPMYLIVSPEIGGDWPGPPDGDTQWPTTAEIDYIRVYRKK